jgi:hypothetical protein
VRQFPFAEAAPTAPRPGAPAPPLPVGGGGRKNWSYAAAVSADGRLIAYGSQASYLAVHEVATGKTVRLVENLQPDGAGTLAFSPDGRTLAWSGWRLPAVHVLELATGKGRQRFDGHKGRVTSLAFSADGKTLISGSEDTTALVWDVVTGGAKVTPLTAGALEACWAGLGSQDAARAGRALGRLAASPAEAVALLKKHLPPAAAPDAKRLAGLIADLDSETFAVREAALKELTDLGEVAEPALRSALEKAPSPEARRRLEELLEKLDSLGTAGEPLRASRAVEALEHIGTPEARRLLTALAAGAPGAWRTREAQAALERLAARR